MDESITNQLELAAQSHWQAEYNFWHKIITEEVERTRFNDGFEPVEIVLYQRGTKKAYQPDFAGQTQIGRRLFYATARWSIDPSGVSVLKLKLFPARQSEAERLAKWAWGPQRLYNDSPAT